MFFPSCAIAPLIIGPLTEVTGRRYTYIFSHMGFVLTFLMLALKVGSRAAMQALSDMKHTLISAAYVSEQHRASLDRSRYLRHVRIGRNYPGRRNFR